MTRPGDLVDLAALERALAGMGWTWDALCSISDEIVIFGSRACGCAHAGSDWDVLCIGNGRSRNTRRIDLLWVSPQEARTHAWQQSELAGHVGTFGRWLHGSPGWTPRFPIDPSPPAQAKARRIAITCRVLERFWDGYASPYRAKYWTKLRRDLQRYDLLRRGMAVPATAWLDATWRAEPLLHSQITRLYQDACGWSPFFARIASEMLPDALPAPAAPDAMLLTAQ